MKDSIALLSISPIEYNAILLSNKFYLDDLVNIHIIPPCFKKESVRKKINSSKAVIYIYVDDKRYNQSAIDLLKESLITYKDKLHIVLSFSQLYTNEIDRIIDLADRNMIFEDFSTTKKHHVRADSHDLVNRLSKLPLKVHVASIIIIEQSILLWRIYGYNQENN